MLPGMRCAHTRDLRFRLIVISLLAAPFFSLAQNQKTIDSLRTVLQSVPIPERGQPYLDLAYAYGMDDPSNAYLSAEEAVHIALDHGDSLLLAKGYNAMGRWKRYTGGSIQRSISLSNQAVALAERQGAINEEFNGHYEIATSYHWLRDQTNFNVHFNACSTLSKSLDNPVLKGKMALMMTFSLRDDFQPDSVGSYYAQALEQFEAANAVEAIIGLKLTLSLEAMRARDMGKALQLRKESQVLARSIKSDYYTFSCLMYEANFGMHNSDSAQKAQLLNELEALAGSMQNKRGLIDYSMFKMREMRAVGNGVEAVAYARKFRSLSQELSINTYLIQSSFHLSSILEQEGHLLEALEEILTVKDLALEVDYLVSFVYSKIADLYLAMGEAEQALEYQQQARAYDLSGNKPISFSVNFYNYLDFAEIHQALENLETAEVYADSAVSIAREYQQSARLMEALTTKSRIAFEAGNPGVAERTLEEAFEIADGDEAPAESVTLSDMHSLGASLFHAKGDYSKSIFHAKQALAMNRESRWAEGSLNNHEILWKSYEAQRMPEKALSHLKQYLTIKDSLFSIEKTAAVLELKEEYEAEQKELKIELLEQDQELAEMVLASKNQALFRNRVFSVGIAVLMITLIIIGWLLFNRYKLRVKADELALQNESYRLEQEREQATQQLEMAKLRTSFLANISHEIRTPLTLIKGPLSQWEEAPESIDAKAVEQMSFNTDRLMNLVDEAMNVVRIENQPLPIHPEPVNAAVFFRNQFDSFTAKAEAREIILVWEDQTNGVDWVLDTYQMERVILNLMSNALRYTPKQGTVRLTLSLVEDELCVQVTDTGKGIEPQHVSNLFERYYRADNNQESGYGLGLAIVKEAVDLHGGSIIAESEVGIGTRFTMRLPRNQKSSDRKPQVIKEPMEDRLPTSLLEDLDNVTQSEDQTTVLVVEDDKNLRDYLVDILSENHRVLTAEDGQQGEEIALSESPELIVSDVMMPRKNGLEMLAALKKNILTSHIPMVLLTAKTEHKDKLSGLEVGADYYLKKPFSPKELQLCLRNMIQRQHRLRQRIGETPLLAQKADDGLTPLDREFLAKANQAVESHLDDDSWTIEQFCQELALNRSSVHVKLKALTGHNASGFIRNVRVHKAAELIRETSYPLSEVADLTGFSNRQAFNRAFKIHLGMSPSSFKDRLKSRPSRVDV